MRLNIISLPFLSSPFQESYKIKTKDNYSEGKTGRVPTTLKINELLHIKYTLSHVRLFFIIIIYF